MVDDDEPAGAGAGAFPPFLPLPLLLLIEAAAVVDGGGGAAAVVVGGAAALVVVGGTAPVVIGGGGLSLSVVGWEGGGAGRGRSFRAAVP